MSFFCSLSRISSNVFLSGNGIPEGGADGVPGGESTPFASPFLPPAYQNPSVDLNLHKHNLKNTKAENHTTIKQLHLNPNESSILVLLYKGPFFSRFYFKYLNYTWRLFHKCLFYNLVDYFNNILRKLEKQV